MMTWKRNLLPNPAVGYASNRIGRNQMNGIIYLVGLVVVVMFILSLLGLR